MHKSILLVSFMLFMLMVLKIGGVSSTAVMAIGGCLFLGAIIGYAHRVYDKASKARAFREAKINYRLHRFVICSGYVKSKYDGDVHLITPGQLIRLYQLKPDEYIIHTKYYKYQPSDILLPPLKDGRYLEYKEEVLSKFYDLQGIGV